jgi:CheY-like chemotaxis protein
MTPAEGRSARDVMLELVGALAPVLGDAGSHDDVRIARDAARQLELEGLELLLAACAPHAGTAWPAELSPALGRLRRVAARAVEAVSVEPFLAADRELAGLADEVAALQWSPVWRTGDDQAHPLATLSVADALEAMPLAGDADRELARRARLQPPVAAALRAALDWLAGGSGRPLSLRAEDSFLEVTFDRLDPGALAAATEVVAGVGGNLGPAPGAAGTWMVRVPLQSGHTAYLMLVVAGLPIAVPWLAVLRMHMAAAGEWDERRELAGWPVMDGPIETPRAPGAGELPLVLVAHGRKRAWLAADRLVWRLHAEPVNAPGRAPAEGLESMVETEAGERYWLADPAWLLHSVEAPAFLWTTAPPASPATAPAAGESPARAGETAPEPVSPDAVDEERASAFEAPPAPAAVPVLPATAPAAEPLPAAAPAFAMVDEPAPAADEPAPAVDEPAPAPESAPAFAPVRRPPDLKVLTFEHVEPLGLEEPTRHAPGPAPAPIVAPPAPRRAPDSARGVAGGMPGPRPAPAWTPDAVSGNRIIRTALVAEDSITARIFLARLLGRLGFDVRTVDSAAALRAELERGAWSLVCVDVELPDESGTAFLAGIVTRHAGRTAFVALVRDAEDRAAARRAGLERTLRKPFDHQELEQVLGRLGFLTPRS